MMPSGEVAVSKSVVGPRIFYFSKHFGYPLGGVRIAHHHVSLLRRNGFDARILLIDDVRDRFFEDQDLVIEKLADYPDFRADDILVVPEPWPGYIRKAGESRARSLVFCQNHFNVFFGLGDALSYAEFGIDGVFCCSHVISNFLQDALGVSEAPVIRNAIDHTLFKPGRKRRQIAFMPRKMKIEGPFLKGLFRVRHPRYRNVPWVRIERETEARVAELLSESEIFLALGRNEGFGLPPIEAMASGCVIAGFEADGGRDYATPKNGFWQSTEDNSAVVDGIAAALDQIDTEDGRRARQAMLQQGFKTAAQYSFASMEEDLLAFWTRQVEIVAEKVAFTGGGA
jgi:glycosyltransferase involved in cell wall biosynthesis